MSADLSELQGKAEISHAVTRLAARRK